MALDIGFKRLYLINSTAITKNDMNLNLYKSFCPKRVYTCVNVSFAWEENSVQ